MDYPRVSAEDIARLKLAIGDKHVSTGESNLDLHSKDESYHAPHRPDVVVWPQKTEDVVAAVKLAAEKGYAVTAWCAGTSLEGTTEDIVFDGTEQNYVNSSPTEDVTATALTDDTRSWIPDQWADHMVHVSCGGTSQEVRITGNDETTLFGTFDPCSAWGYRIYRPLANSYDHWTSIDSITSSDMDVDVEIYNVAGEFVASLVSGMADAGTNQVEWDCTNRAGNEVVSGVYLCILRAPGHEETIRMTLFR